MYLLIVKNFKPNLSNSFTTGIWANIWPMLSKKPMTKH